MSNNFLKHYGILGMKWGRRKGNSSVTVVRATDSDDHNKRIALRQKRLSEMTNDELQAYTKRMTLEKSYKELSKSEISFGQKLVNDMINSAKKGATDAAMNYINKQSAKMIEELIKKTVKAAT